jgi:hypothetical protein
MSTSHSSGSFNAGNCFNGNTGDFCHTHEGVGAGGHANPWLQLDLGSAQRVSEVKIHNRDGNEDRLANHEIWLADGSGADGFSAAAGAVRCFEGSVAAATVYVEACEGSGRYVTIVQPTEPGKGRILNLAEVEVFQYGESMVSGKKVCVLTHSLPTMGARTRAQVRLRTGTRTLRVRIYFMAVPAWQFPHEVPAHGSSRIAVAAWQFPYGSSRMAVPAWQLPHGSSHMAVSAWQLAHGS